MMKNRAVSICCPRCRSTKGTLIHAKAGFGSYFFCANRCDQNSLWNRLKLRFGFGRWRVIYPDGQPSRPMCARAAKSYRAIFKGVIIPTKAPIVDLGLR